MKTLKEYIRCKRLFDGEPEENICWSCKIELFIVMETIKCRI